MPTFPPVEVFDSFKRPNENPLNNGGKWENFLATREGGVVSEAFTQTFEEFAGFSSTFYYWTPAQFSVPDLAVAVEAKNLASQGQIAWNLFITTSVTEFNGFIVTIQQEGEGFETPVTTHYKLAASAGGEVTGKLGFEAASGDRVGLSIQEGKAIAWYKQGGGEWKELASLSSVITKGYIGVGTGAEHQPGESFFSNHLINFEGPSSSEAPPVLTCPGTQKNFVGDTVSLQVKATHTTEYKATGLPKGLSINASTGLITGKPTTAEETMVLLTVKGPGGEAHCEFKWIVEACVKPGEPGAPWKPYTNAPIKAQPGDAIVTASSGRVLINVEGKLHQIWP